MLLDDCKRYGTLAFSHAARAGFIATTFINSFVNNKFSKPTFVYDSGIRLNLVEDYFELYLPVYSNLGWEMGQNNYQKP